MNACSLNDFTLSPNGKDTNMLIVFGLQLGHIDHIVAFAALQFFQLTNALNLTNTPNHTTPTANHSTQQR